MLKTTAVLMAISLFVVSAFPTTEDNKFDKVKHNDASVNSVSPRATETEKKDVVPAVSVTSTGTVGISTPEDNSPSVILPTPPKIKPGTMIARFIDDVFQIPISVLQSVTKLLTNPFTQHHKDDASS